MSSPHTTAAYPDLVSDVAIRFQANLEVFAKDPIEDHYYNEPWTSGDPKIMTFQTLALPSYGRRRTELERPKKVSATMGNQIQKSFWAYSAAVDVTIEMLTFDREKVAQSIADNLVKTCMANRKLEQAHQLLTYADVASYQPMDCDYTVSFATPDGNPVGYASHTVPGSSDTFSNILTDEDPLRPESLALLIAQCQRNAVNDKGDIIDVNFDQLWIPDDFEMVKRAVEILQTPNVPFKFENTVNYFNGGNFRGKPMQLVVFAKGARGRDGKYADGTQNDGTGVTATARRFHWGVADSMLNGNTFDTGANRYATAGKAMTYKAPPVESGLYSIWANMFSVFVVTRWQGKGYSFAETL